MASKKDTPETAAEPESATNGVNTYTVLSNLHRDGKLYLRRSPIKLSDKDAAPLLKAKQIAVKAAK